MGLVARAAKDFDSVSKLLRRVLLYCRTSTKVMPENINKLKITRVMTTLVRSPLRRILGYLLLVHFVEVGSHGRQGHILLDNIWLIHSGTTDWLEQRYDWLIIIHHLEGFLN